MTEQAFTFAELMRWAMNQGPSVVVLFYILVRLEGKLDSIKEAIDSLKS